VVILSAIFGISMGTVSFRTALLVTGKTLEYFLIFLIVLNCLRSERDVKAFIIMAIVISVISCLAGFARATHPTEEGFVFEGRVMGPYGETANILAGYILFHLAIVTGLFLHADRFSYRFILGMIFFLLFYTMLVTFSRTGYIALVGGFILFGLLKKRQFLLMLFVIFILFAIMAPQSVKERMATIIKIPTSTPPPSFAARRAAWEAAFDRVTLSPIFGFGPGYTPLGWVDNEYIRVMQDLGFLGLAVFLWFLYKLGRQAFHVCGRVRHDWLIRGYTVGFLIAFLSILVHALGATSFTSIRTMEIFMVLTALFVSIANNYRQWEAEHTHHRRHSRHHHRVKHKRIGIS
jgi:O-antigen ligase